MSSANGTSYASIASTPLATKQIKPRKNIHSPMEPLKTTQTSLRVLRSSSKGQASTSGSNTKNALSGQASMVPSSLEEISEVPSPFYLNCGGSSPRNEKSGNSTISIRGEADAGQVHGGSPHFGTKSSDTEEQNSIFF